MAASRREPRIAQPSAAERYEYVPLTLVHPSETNPRHFVDDEALAELAADIRVAKKKLAAKQAKR